MAAAAAAQYAICRAEEEKPLPLADKEKVQLCVAVVPSLSPPALGTGNRGAGDSRLNLYGIGLTLPKNAKWKLLTKCTIDCSPVHRGR